jgi:transcriptional regulator with XRE-family HTH domain
MSQNELDRKAGATLKELRQQAGMSRETLSFSAATDQSTLSKVERPSPGAVPWPRFCQIAQALGYEIEIVFRPISKSGTSKSEDSGAARRR